MRDAIFASIFYLIHKGKSTIILEKNNTIDIFSISRVDSKIII